MEGKLREGKEQCSYVCVRKREEEGKEEKGEKEWRKMIVMCVRKRERGKEIRWGEKGRKKRRIWSKRKAMSVRRRK